MRSAARTLRRRLLALRSIGGPGILFAGQENLVSEAFAGFSEQGWTGRRRRPLGIEETLEPIFLLHIALGDGHIANGDDHAVQNLRGAADAARAREAGGQCHDRQKLCPKLKKNWKFDNRWTSVFETPFTTVTTSYRGGFKLYPKSKLSGPTGVLKRNPRPTAWEV